MNSRFLTLIILLLILSIFSSRALKEENNEGKEEENDCEDGTCESKNEVQPDFSKIPSTKIKKENMPHSQVLLPIRRVGTTNMELGDAPCGGIEKKAANTLTTKGSSINLIWEILVPENTGNCTVKLSNGRQDIDSFQLLKPTEGAINSDGSFKCGREKGFEHKEFILPPDYECDGCTLQWKWSTSYGDIYSCSDIIINGAQLSKCMGKCLNGGSCFNGQCLCLKGFSGDFCEDEDGQTSLTWLWILLGLIGLGAIGYGIYYFWPKIKSLFHHSQPWTHRDDKNPNFLFNEESQKDGVIDQDQLAQNSKYAE
jgi:hypothetical protein